MKEDRRKVCFESIKNTNINELRNRVVHSMAYRPTIDEVNPFEQLRRDIIWLGQYLEIEDSIYILNERVDIR